MIPKNPEADAGHSKKLVPIHFEFNNPEAVAVHVAGSFNEWSADASPLTRGYGGRWGRVAMLEPGRHEYCLVVDGRWVLDPMNPVSTHNPFGSRNSVCTVPEPNVAAHLIDTAVSDSLDLGGRTAAMSPMATRELKHAGHERSRFTQFCRRVGMVRTTVVAAVKFWRRHGPISEEAERIDRIRNPQKYLIKVNATKK